MIITNTIISLKGYRALLAIGLNEPLLLLRVAGIESWKLEGTDEYRAHCIQVLLDLIRQNPAAIITHIPTFIEILLPGDFRSICIHLPISFI